MVAADEVMTSDLADGEVHYVRSPSDLMRLVVAPSRPYSSRGSRPSASTRRSRCRRCSCSGWPPSGCRSYQDGWRSTTSPAGACS